MRDATARAAGTPAVPVGRPLVSVIIPCFNQARFLGDAIESVLAQTYPHHEIVVVDDGSPDNTEEVAARYPGVKYIRQANAGLSGARNTGWRHSSGTHVVFLDSDDRLLPEALSVGVEALAAHPSSAFVWGWCRHMRFDGTPLPAEPTPQLSGNHYAELLRDCYVWMPGVAMFRRAALIAAGGFAGRFGTSADHELYLRLARDHQVTIHAQVIGEYRRHGSNMTRDAALNLKERLLVLRAQRTTVWRRRGECLKAYRQGVRFARDFYGEPLALDVFNAVATKQYRRMWRGLRVLLRFHPAAAAQLVTRSLAVSWSLWRSRRRSVLH